MILAAGLGTRLRPLTDDRPKALVDVGGRTMLEITLSRLRAFDIREEVLLDTGGGLKKAAGFFLEDPRDFETPFIVHNVDVISTIDFRRMAQFHTENQALATLAVKDRETSRYLLFDERHQLCGRRTGRDQKNELVQPPQPAQALAFSGIHIVSPRLLELLLEDGTFSIITTYLRLAADGEKILGFRADDYYWRDMGRPDDVLQAARDLKQQILS
jgi:NDP-sugar pyrophosphorylase family protein